MLKFSLENVPGKCKAIIVKKVAVSALLILSPLFSAGVHADSLQGSLSRLLGSVTDGGAGSAMNVLSSDEPKCELCGERVGFALGLSRAESGRSLARIQQIRQTASSPGAESSRKSTAFGILNAVSHRSSNALIVIDQMGNRDGVIDLKDIPPGVEIGRYRPLFGDGSSSAAEDVHLYNLGNGALDVIELVRGGDSSLAVIAATKLLENSGATK